MVLLLCIFFAGCGTRPHPGVIVLGVDGMSPDFVERHWSDLPNLASLRDRGTFTRLVTTDPPQSPVAWATFITGLDPGAHGLFDFVQRDPATLQLYSSMTKTEAPRFTLPIGPYVLPLSGSRVMSLRRGTPFWELLSKQGIPVTVVRMPTNYPPVPAGHGLSGLGTPDLRGTLGTFTFYTDDPIELSRPVPGGRIVKVDLDRGHAVLPVEGPPNTLRKDGRYATASLEVDVDPENPAARLSAGGQATVIREGEWSDWMTADFTLIPHLSSVRGAFRVFAKQLHPQFELYLSPINIDPASPVLPITSPAEWSREIARETGRFYTLGFPEDTAALRQRVFSFPEFQAQTRLVFEDEHKLLEYSLRHFHGGFLFFYFSSVDQNSHMMWGRHEPELLEVYRAIDACVGETMRAAPGAELIVMSDHGFTSFDRAVHLNTWLSHRGFLTLKTPPGDDTSLDSLDWSSTEAYAVGLNELYVNLKGREAHGIVPPGERSKATLENLRDQLLAWRDPANGRQVVESVESSNASPQNAAVAPDLIVGYARGYRGSWQTALGATPADEIDDNNDSWIADHCINPADVPGVLFTNRKIDARNPKLADVTASILHLFGVSPLPSMTGRSFYQF